MSSTILLQFFCGEKFADELCGPTYLPNDKFGNNLFEKGDIRWH